MVNILSSPRSNTLRFDCVVLKGRTVPSQYCSLLSKIILFVITQSIKHGFPRAERSFGQSRSGSGVQLAYLLPRPLRCHGLSHVRLRLSLHRGTLSLPSFKMEFGLDKVSKKETAALSANIVSTFQAGCFFGAIICYAITEKLGRRITLLICGAVFDIGTILQLASSGKLGLIYAGRAFTGQCSGMPLMV